jgi:beta-alanine--pyruvate transaminase
VGAIDLSSKPDAVGRRAYDAMDRGFHEEDVLMRITGDTIALSPPLIITEAQIGELIEKVGRTIRKVLN